MENTGFSEKLVLIDGNSLINRAFFALPPLSDSEGRITNAVYGFSNILIKIITEQKPKYLAVCFDVSYPTFRHLMYAGYKSNRKRMPEDLASQVPILKELLNCMGIAVVEKKGYEADDLIGAIAKSFGGKVDIITGDRDALQLIDKNISVHLTKKGISETVVINNDNIVSAFGVTPERIVDLKALMGDASDNIPGVAGIGEKTALKLLSDFGSLDGIYQNLDQIKGKLRENLENGKESAYLSYQLATIKCELPPELRNADFSYPYPFDERAKEMFRRLNFHSLLRREIFEKSAPEDVRQEKHKCEVIQIKDLKSLEGISVKDNFAFVVDDAIHIAADNTEYIITLSYNLLDCEMSLEAVLGKLKPILTDAKIQKTVFDNKALRHYLSGYGIELNNYWDVQLAQYVVDSSRSYLSASNLLNDYNIETSVPAFGLLAVRKKLEPLLDAVKGLFYGIEMPLSEVLYDMEKVGFKLDIAVLEELRRKFLSEINSISRKIYALAGEEFNINSPKQLAVILYDKLNLYSSVKTKTKARSTGAEALEDLRGEHEIVDLILRYRLLSKLNSTYIEGLKKMAGSDGVVHTEFRQALTVTGRLSSVEPNLQNIPVRDEEGREIRKAFVAREGRVLVTADYSQIELRLLAHFSQEPKLIEAFLQNEDIHLRTASEVFGVPPAQVTPAMRREAKAVNFGIIYGISDFGLAKNLGIPVNVARRYIQRYFENYPRVKEYMDKNIEYAKKHGRITLASGRSRKLPELKSPNRNIRLFGERAAMNMPLQGTAADLIKVAMINVYNRLKDEGLKSKLILQVHDELIVEALEEEREAVKKILKEEMENAMKFSVPVTVEIKSGASWFGVK